MEDIQKPETDEVMKEQDTSAESVAEEVAEEAVDADGAAIDAEAEETAEPDASADAEDEGEADGDADSEDVGEGSEEADPDEKEDNGKGGKKGFFGFKKKEKKDPRDEQIETLKTQLLRSQADFDNYRKRTEKDMEAKFDLGSKNVIEKLLPVIDNFERALAMIPEEERDSSFAEGLDKIYKQFTKMLDDMGVVPMDPVGKPFDPNLHNAVMQVPAEEGQEENIVVEEFQKGYLYKDYVVRYSMVKVTV